MKAPQPIPYQGSKRALAPLILKYFPKNIERLIEPFAGSAAISIATAIRKKADKYWINDLNKPLIDLLSDIVNNPERISSSYKKLWEEQLGKEKEFFIETRKRFNNYFRTDDFLYVLARCVKGAVRYNSNGEFNQSADNRRKGKNPLSMEKEIYLFSNLLKNKTQFTSKDYTEIFKEATDKDLIYMDPPYQGTSNQRDSRYLAGIGFNEFVENLKLLNIKGVPFLLSYDGKLGNKSYGNDLPVSLNLHKIMIEVGRSTTSTLLGNKAITYEALYLSESLIDKLDENMPAEVFLKTKQLQLL